MKDVPMTEVVQYAYDRAKEDLRLGRLPIKEIQDLRHVAHKYALLDLYQGSKNFDPIRHYIKPIDELYKLFDKGTLSEEDAYASFAFLNIHEITSSGLFRSKMSTSFGIV